MKNRKIALILCVVLICSLLAGCMKNSEAVNFAGEIELGEDGIVTKTVLEGLRDAGDIASICGKTGQFSERKGFNNVRISPRSLAVPRSGMPSRSV